MEAHSVSLPCLLQSMSEWWMKIFMYFFIIMILCTHTHTRLQIKMLMPLKLPLKRFSGGKVGGWNLKGGSPLPGRGHEGQTIAQLCLSSSADQLHARAGTVTVNSPHFLSSPRIRTAPSPLGLASHHTLVND